MPKHFDSSETDSPFTHCSACGCELELETAYIINKSYVNGECVFEMALCINCREELNSQLSQKSKEAVYDFIESNADFAAQKEQLGEDYTMDEALSTCLTCGKDAKNEKNFSIGCMFSVGMVIPDTFPMLICGECEEKMNDVVSPETRSTWDRFIGENFPGPPSELSLPKNKPMLI